MALITTFATTPLTSILFPPWYQKKISSWKRGEIDWDGNRLSPDDGSSEQGDFIAETTKSSEIRKLLVCLRLDGLPSLFTFVALLAGEKTSTSTIKTHPKKIDTAMGQNEKPIDYDSSNPHERPLQVHGLRMLELTDRLSSVMKEVELAEWSFRDPVVNAFHTFGHLNNVAVSGEVELVPEGSYVNVLNERAVDRSSDLIIFPWSETGNLSEIVSPADLADVAQQPLGSGAYNHFVGKFLDNAPCSAAIFVNKGFGALRRDERSGLSRVPTSLSLRSTSGQPTVPIIDRSHHIFFPFIGGPDDRVALRFVLKLAKNPNVTATILHVRGTGMVAEDLDTIEQAHATTTKGNPTTVTTMSQGTSHDQDRAFLTSMADSLSEDLQSRVLFDTIDSAQPVHDSVEHARAEVGMSPKNAGDLIVVGRSCSHGRRGTEMAKVASGSESDIGQSLGRLAEAVIKGDIRASVLVIRAGGTGAQV